MRGESSEGKSLIIFSSNYFIDFLEGTVTASLDTTSPPLTPGRSQVLGPVQQEQLWQVL